MKLDTPILFAATTNSKRARKFYEEALGLIREIGYHEQELACLNNLAGAQVELGKFSHAESAVLGVTLADGIYIFLSALGVAALLENPRIQTVFKIFGFLVLSFFSFTMIFHAVSVWGRPLSASPAGPSVFPFFSGLFLTLSSPLTILFWAGVFSVKVSESRFSRPDLIGFSTGCLSATWIFLSLASLLFSSIRAFLNESASRTAFRPAKSCISGIRSRISWPPSRLGSSPAG